MSVRKTIFEWGIWLLHTFATCRIYGITEESGTHAPWLFTSYDPWDEAARSCKYSASSMLWWTMFPNVPHLSQQTSKRHYHPLVYPSFIGFIMFYEYHHGGSWGLQQSNKSPPIRWPPRSWSVPFENETAMPQGQPAQWKPGTPDMANNGWIFQIIPTRIHVYGSMWFYMLEFGWINFVRFATRTPIEGEGGGGDKTNLSNSTFFCLETWDSDPIAQMEF